MPERISARKRIQLQNVAEREVLRYADSHGLWHKHVHNVELDQVQLLKMQEMDEHNNTIDFSSRRTGKTACKEMYELKDNACNPDQELGIVAPREAQAIVNLNYHLDAIRRSPVLSNYLAFKSGRKQMSDTRYEFANRSKAQAYGIMAQVDGGDLTKASLEEVDDMPKARLDSRFLLMLGSSRRLGASKQSRNDPKIRITGVFKGADTLADMAISGTYRVIGAVFGDAARNLLQRMIAADLLSADAVDVKTYKYPIPIANAMLAMEMDLLQRSFIMQMKDELSEDEFVRQLLCINIASRNLVWEEKLRRALHIGFEVGLEIVEPMPGEKYKKSGLISFGYDHSGHGERKESSRYAFVVLEQIGNFTCTRYARTWPPGTDEKIVEADLLAYWQYFDPDCAIGDAYGIGMMTNLNDQLYFNNLTTINRRNIGEGESTASTWSEWAFAPLRFEGMTKHSMAQAVRSSFHSHQAAMPYVEDCDADKLTQTEQDMRLLQRQITNIVPMQTKTSYSTYKMADAKLGDDCFDAYMAAHWALVTRGALIVPSIIQINHTNRAKLLGQKLRATG
ncbi:MAG: hypothetical protein OEZ10_11590 [Gammaproteobacteria bacterium]|nr:hypothetical protein [Gammaproteobacteria bacterium]